MEPATSQICGQIPDYNLSAITLGANRVTDQPNAGVVRANTWLHRDLRTPFGGMSKSGVGREGDRLWDFLTEAQKREREALKRYAQVHFRQWHLAVDTA